MISCLCHCNSLLLFLTSDVQYTQTFTARLPWKPSLRQPRLFLKKCPKQGQKFHPHLPNVNKGKGSMGKNSEAGYSREDTPVFASRNNWRINTMQPGQRLTAPSKRTCLDVTLT